MNDATAIRTTVPSVSPMTASAGEAGGDFVPQLMSVGIDDDVKCPEAACGSHVRTLPGSMEIVDRADRPSHQ